MFEWGLSDQNVRENEQKMSFALKDTFLRSPYWHLKEHRGSEEHSLREAGLVNWKFGLF
jgi:hypothetical protein